MFALQEIISTEREYGGPRYDASQPTAQQDLERLLIRGIIFAHDGLLTEVIAPEATPVSVSIFILYT